MPNRIRVMYVIASMGNALAGTERNLHTIITHLDRTEFEPHLVVLQDCEFIRQRDYACPTSCLRLNRMFTPLMWKKRRDLAREICKLHIDIVQTFATDAHLVGGGAARLAGVRAIISSRRDLGFAYTRKEKMYLRVANRYPHRFLANSNAIADEIVFLEGIDRRRIDVIHNGVEVPAGLAGPAGSGTTAVMVANLRAVKSIPVLVEAAVRVRKVIRNARYVLVGDGPERMNLESMAVGLGVREDFVFAGAQTDVYPFVTTSDVGVLTSSSEGFSNAILEYMAAGLPVVATNVGGNREVVEDGKTGFLVPPSDPQALADRLVYLFQNPTVAREMGSHGRERVIREFSLEVMMAKHQDYYARLLGRTVSHPQMTSYTSH